MYREQRGEPRRKRALLASFARSPPLRAGKLPALVAATFAHTEASRDA